jgi:hypothetical protein
MAGGILLGGFLIAVATLFDELAVAAAPEVTQIAFAAGTVLGFVHGSVIAVLGRPSDMPKRDALASVMAGALWSIPAVFVGFFITLWLSMTRYAFVARQPLLITGVLVSWLVGVVVCGWFFVQLWRAAKNAIGRWPERAWGTALILLTFVALYALLALKRPEIWWTSERMSAAGAAIFAFGITIWAALPLEVLLLHAIRRKA